MEKFSKSEKSYVLSTFKAAIFLNSW